MSLLMVAVSFSGCAFFTGETESEGAGGEAAAAAPECFEVSVETLRALAGSMPGEVPALAVTGIEAVELDGYWYIGAELEGSDYEGPGDVALWATDQDPTEGASELVAANSLAIEESDFQPDEAITEEDSAVDKLTTCIEETVKAGAEG